MDGYIGEIRPFAFNYPPYGWVPCDGATYSIMSKQALYAVIGTLYGGTPGQNFKVPDLRGMTLLGVNSAVSGYTAPGVSGGVDKVTLDTSTMAPHNHRIVGVTRTGAGQTADAKSAPASDVYLTNAYSLGLNKGVIAYSTTVNQNVVMAQNTIYFNTLNPVVTPHSNVSPYLATNYCICVEGVFPVHD
jgi:microcystin-dependent protein